MTPEQLKVCEAISLYFEPKPDMPPLNNDRSLRDHIWPSSTMFWELASTAGWTPRYNFYTDESASALLQRAILVEVDTPELLSLIGEDQWITIQRNIYDKVMRRFDDGADLGNIIREAWVNAFLACKGIEVK